jgi:hypothetical protein
MNLTSAAGFSKTSAQSAVSTSKKKIASGETPCRGPSRSCTIDNSSVLLPTRRAPYTTTTTESSFSHWSRPDNTARRMAGGYGQVPGLAQYRARAQRGTRLRRVPRGAGAPRHGAKRAPALCSLWICFAVAR